MKSNLLNQLEAADKDPAQEQRGHNRRDDAPHEHQRVERLRTEGQAIRTIRDQQTENEIQRHGGEYNIDGAAERNPETRRRSTMRHNCRGR